MYKPITIKDIARALAISTSTVSRALSDSYEINEETKKRIIQYAEKHMYKRNPNASSLRRGRSYTIGVIVCEVANSFFSQVISGIESVAYSKGYHVILSQSHDSYEREVLNIQHLANSSVDGLLISMSAETRDFSHIVDLHTRGLPFVFFDRIINEFETHTVTANNKEGARQATQSLIDRGYKNIAHLANAPHLSITKERLEGFKQALQQNDLPFDKSLIRYCVSGGRNQQEIEEAVGYLSNHDREVDAIFVASDRLSMGCIQAYHQVKPLDPPPAIAGFSNSDTLNMLYRDFTCIRQPAFEMGRAAMEKLIHLIESRHPIYSFDKIVLETEMIIN